MKLKCNVCGAIPEKRKLPKAGFVMVAYENCVEWPQLGEKVPTDETAGWQRLLTAPKVGDVHTVKVTFPFDVEVGGEFWTLFEPAYSYFNGWDEKPEEIAQSALVKCRLDRIVEEMIKHSWITISVQDVMMLSDISERIPAVCYDENVAWNIAEFEDKFEYENWTYYSWSGQGDVGGWSLVYTDSLGVHHLILNCEWGMHEDYVYCGNVIVELAELVKFKYSDKIKQYYKMQGETK